MTKQNKKQQQLTDDEVSKLLYDLLFKQKVNQLGNLDIEHHKEYVVVDKGSNKTEQK